MAAKPSENEELLPADEIAAVFGVTTAAVTEWAKRGKLTPVAVERGGPRYRRGQVRRLYARIAAGVERGLTGPWDGGTAWAFVRPRRPGRGRDQKS